MSDPRRCGRGSCPVTKQVAHPRDRRTVTAMSEPSTPDSPLTEALELQEQIAEAFCRLYELAAITNGKARKRLEGRVMHYVHATVHLTGGPK